MLQHTPIVFLCYNEFLLGKLLRSLLFRLLQLLFFFFQLLTERRLSVVRHFLDMLNRFLNRFNRFKKSFERQSTIIGSIKVISGNQRAI